MLNRPTKKFIYIFLLLIAQVGILSAQDNIPAAPVPPRLVNDFAGLLSQGDRETLEHKLVAYNDTTSTQIAVVIVKSLAGYEPSDYAQRLGQP